MSTPVSARYRLLASHVARKSSPALSLDNTPGIASSDGFFTLPYHSSRSPSMLMKDVRYPGDTYAACSPSVDLIRSPTSVASPPLWVMFKFSKLPSWITAVESRINLDASIELPTDVTVTYEPASIWVVTSAHVTFSTDPSAPPSAIRAVVAPESPPFQRKSTASISNPTKPYVSMSDASNEDAPVT